MTQVMMPAAVMAAVEEHSFSDVQHEVGGVLFGTFTDDGVQVAGAVPALKATADQTSVTFTHEVWDEVHALLDTEHPGQRIVGWYHTHPGFGLFLSDYDTFIHRNFFADEKMVALVVDPVAGDYGWFSWVDGDVVRTRTAATARAATGTRAPAPTAVEQQRSGVRKAVPWLVLAALGVAAAGFALGASTGGDDQVPPRDTGSKEQLISAQEKAQSLELQVEDLRARLVEAQEQQLGEPVGPDGPATFTYVVREGDTLSAIASFLYGDPARYRRIVKANPGLDPDALAIGQRLVLPVPTQKGE